MFSKFLKLKLKPYSSVFTKSEFVSEWNILFIQTEIIRFVHDRQKRGNLVLMMTKACKKKL